YWSITYSEGEFSIIAHKSAGTTRNILRLNSTNNLFNCYASGQNPVKLYVLNPEPTNASKLETFGRLYLNSSENPLVTSETGVDGTSCRKLYLTAKKALSGAWSCIKTDLQNDTTGLALRYEAWARANGDQTPYDGNEAIVNMLNLRATLTNSQSTESSIALVVVIAVISLSSICCYFALNRKKEQK
ncbi:MAG: hypothetical protein SPJ49_03565, partial [Bacilli bacterium]|nr:hypothetical protein [Bacilli bacterium]